MFLLYLCSFLIILGYDCTSPRTLTLSRVRIPSLRMFQSWFVVSPVTTNGGQAVADAFMRIYGIDIRKAGALNMVYLDVQRIG